ncbi:MAG TPA: hypothetical protein VK553_04385, partial [Candidatus Nitrosopolaris rasttigaisensis]|nr:hypothetical protein [Candidatus Nitrosopolaris rasttigaisensis]
SITFSACLCMIILSMFPFVLQLGMLVNIITTPHQVYAQPCVNTSSTTLKPLQNTGGLYIFHPTNERSMGQEKICSTPNAQLIIINHINNTGCSTECLSTSNSTITVLGNNPKPIAFKVSTKDTTVTLDPGHYTVVEPRMSVFYGQVLSPDCLGIISAGETKKCIIINSYSNYVQTWLDKINNIKIQFGYSPPYPFVGNVTQLNFKVSSANTNKGLDLTHIHIAVIKNVTANFNNSNTINNKNYFVTFDNLTAPHGIFSLKYQFLQEGAHQVIIKIAARDSEIALASFDIPVLLPE